MDQPPVRPGGIDQSLRQRQQEPVGLSEIPGPDNLYCRMDEKDENQKGQEPQRAIQQEPRQQHALAIQQLCEEVAAQRHE